MIGLDRKFAQIDALKKLGFTIHQCWVLQFCLDWYAIDHQDVKERYLSIHALRRLKKDGHLVKIEATKYEPAHFVISESTMKLINQGLK